MDTVCGKNPSTQGLLLLHSDNGNAHVEDVAYLRELLQTATMPAILSPTIITQAVFSTAAVANQGITANAKTLENQARE